MENRLKVEKKIKVRIKMKPKAKATNLDSIQMRVKVTVTLQMIWVTKVFFFILTGTARKFTVHTKNSAVDLYGQILA